jgi:hypothetical protein
MNCLDGEDNTNWRSGAIRACGWMRLPVGWIVARFEA